MTKIEFFELPAGVRITQMHKGPKLFKEFSEKEIGFLKRNIKAGSIVLDVGCGTGKHISILAAKAKSVTGIDSSCLMIEKAKQFLQGARNVKLFLADAEKMPFCKNSFDFIICTRNTFGNLLDRQAALKEMKRVLKPAGKMFIGVYSQQAERLQLAHYKRNKIRITKISKGAVYAFPDFKSERFSKQKLRKIFRAQNLCAEIIQLNKIAFECVVQKSFPLNLID